MNAYGVMRLCVGLHFRLRSPKRLEVDDEADISPKIREYGLSQICASFRKSYEPFACIFGIALDGADKVSNDFAWEVL